MGFDKEKTRWLVLDYCSHYSPRTATAIAAMLKKKISDFYVNTPPEKLAKQIRKLAQPLITNGLLLKYTRKSKAWIRAREMTTKAAQARGEKAPRNISELYQTNFLLLNPNSQLPIVSLPTPDPALNFEMCALMHRFQKPVNYCWEMINLLLVAREKQGRDDLRVHLYVLPFDYDEAELLEHVLDFAQEFNDISLPLKPSIEEAKNFLRHLAVGKH